MIMMTMIIIPSTIIIIDDCSDDNVNNSNHIKKIIVIIIVILIIILNNNNNKNIVKTSYKCKKLVNKSAKREMTSSVRSGGGEIRIHKGFKQPQLPNFISNTTG